MIIMEKQKRKDAFPETIEHKPKPKTRGVTLRTPKDLMRILADVISEIFRENKQVEHSGKIFQIGSVWLKAYETATKEDLMPMLEEIKERLDRMEGVKK
jgi:hypothetical protein